MITMSIQDSKEGKLKLWQIYDYIMKKFPFYRHQVFNFSTILDHNLNLYHLHHL